ncbi:excinuclease ABC subunit B [Candidatus Peregrinibacteria bacterium CG10_big_fil_rev_8_21_14_0_10_36_19]|nr:MAG: excinuclease ABC subunit B [Candidatus Peregrinibacteria bacterium CG10_big_fil_rev_8_21_14_0_10_36_19]
MVDKKFVLKSDMKPMGDQPAAIKQLTTGLQKGEQFQTLLGVTGSGKTYTMAKVVEEMQRPALVLAHNKTLAAQLCSEFQEFFPDNAVSYFVSYYDYYQPEAYKPSTDTYIEKDAAINEEIDKFRHAATKNLLTRRDVLIVASVSCIYGLGSVDDYTELAFDVKVGDMVVRDNFLRRLSDIQYVRSSMDFKNSMFHVLGDVVEVFPPDSDTVIRFEFFGDEIEAINEVDSFTGELIRELEAVKIFPAKHNVTTEEKIERAVDGIRADLEERYTQLKKMGKMIEAERIKTRTEYDIEILLETGYCNGIENYVRYFDNKEPGQRPTTLMDYLPSDFMLFIDESHISVPQIGGMHNGNLSRKQTLIEHGFRLPSAYDNRPLRFDEFEGYMKNTVFVSATPGKYELAVTPKKNIAEQVVRPTGLVDPEISVRPTKGQIEDLLKEIKMRIDKGDRILITTLTKRSAEDMTDFLTDADLRVKYLHSDIDTIERIEILRDLRLGKFDILVGINLLREGLDLPEVSLVAIMDADKQGFLRSTSALIQTVGRCARNAEGFVIMYADRVTDAMAQCIDETQRRRTKQIEYNKEHGITPETIKKAVKDIAQFGGKKKDKVGFGFDVKKVPKDELKRLITVLEGKMDLASQNFEFEKAAELRDEIDALREEYGL